MKNRIVPKNNEDSFSPEFDNIIYDAAKFTIDYKNLIINHKINDMTNNEIIQMA